MNRTGPTRLLSSLLAVAMFLATSGQGFGYRRTCPHHDAPPSATAAETGHAHHAAQDAPSHDGHGGPCDCLGTCTIATPQPVPTGGTVAVLPAPAVQVRVQRSAVPVVTTVRIDHVIPFANAPPLV